MVTLLHGDNSTASRNAYNALRDAVTEGEKRLIDGNGIDAGSLEQAVSSCSLFGEPVSVFVENLFSPIGRKTKLIQALGKIVAEVPDTATVVLWEPKALGKEAIGSLGPKVKAQLFEYPKTVFAALDGLRPGNVEKVIGLLRTTFESEAPEVVFSLMVGRVRQLIQIKDGITPDRMQSWQVGRLTSQASAFTMDKLLSMHAEFIDIDLAAKSGASPLPLSFVLEQFVLKFIS